MIRLRVLSLAAMLIAPAGFAAAQSPWPNAAPNAAPAASAASPWGDAPAASAPAASAAWPASPQPGAFAPAPSQSAAPAGPSPWSAAPQRNCAGEFVPLREAAEKRAGAIKTAAAKKSQPAICAAFKNFAEAEAKMVKFITDHGKECGIPADAAKNIKASHAKTLETRDRICSANAGQQAAPRRAPSLSDALGTSRLPDISAGGQSKGGTFNTLTGNAPR